jgi:EAL domain-containing protein (putative c-di-GMP-specific phosphodiesterase class I)
LAYLRRFPIDGLKVDRSFIWQTEAQEATILEAVVGLGHALGLEVTAEGVESAEHLALVRALGFDAAQGYHFALPLTPEEAAAYVAGQAGPAGAAGPAESAMVSAAD